MRRDHSIISNSKVGPSPGLDSADDCRNPHTVRTSGAGALAFVLARHDFTETGAGAFTLQRPCFSVQARDQQSEAFFTVAPGQVGQVFPVFSSNRERSKFTSSRPHNAPDRFAKESVGGFHGVSLMQLHKTSSLEAFEQ